MYLAESCNLNRKHLKDDDHGDDEDDDDDDDHNDGPTPIPSVLSIAMVGMTPVLCTSTDWQFTTSQEATKS